MFPSPPAKGITLRALNIKEPVPEALHGAYDLVHVRMIVAAMLPTDWPVVVANVVKMVKPGGWVQWEECDMTATKHLRGRLESTVSTIRSLSEMFRGVFKERFACGFNTLPGDLEKAGLKHIIRDIVSTDRVPETRQPATENGLRALIAWADKTGALKGEELEKAKRDAEQDIKSGCYVRFEIYVAAGQKPLEG